MKSRPADTIAAVVTPLGEGGIGVIQVVGPQAIPIAERIFRPTRPRDLASATEGRLCHGFIQDKNGVIDEAILRVCPRAKLVEINCHGGITAVRQAFDLVVGSGATAAPPEELLIQTHGRDLDKIRREVLRLLPDAPTRLAVRMLSAQYSGVLSSRLSEIAQETDARSMRAGLDVLLDTADFGIGLCVPRRIVVAGKPNVGKSTLVNALLREDRVIVHHLPGTTRDAISETAELRGIPFEVIDTAGIRQAKHEIEALGVAESKREIRNADVILLLLDLSEPLGPEDQELLRMAEDRVTLAVANKADKAPAWDIEKMRHREPLKISALTGEGLEELEETIVSRCGGNTHDPIGPIVFTQRQRNVLASARQALDVQHIDEARSRVMECLAEPS